jgi:hypothetical protein
MPFFDANYVTHGANVRLRVAHSLRDICWSRYPVKPARGFSSRAGANVKEATIRL